MKNELNRWLNTMQPFTDYVSKTFTYAWENAVKLWPKATAADGDSPDKDRKLDISDYMDNVPSAEAGYQENPQEVTITFLDKCREYDNYSDDETVIYFNCSSDDEGGSCKKRVR